jgi:hypothetical protein
MRKMYHLTTMDATRASVVVVGGGWWLMPLPLSRLLLEKKTIKIRMNGKKNHLRWLWWTREESK